MNKSLSISAAEWDIMTLLWSKAPLAASDIVTQLQLKRGWQPRTTRTLLDRLVKKKVLATELEGRRYLYRPLVDIDTCLRQESQSFLERVFGGEPVSMLVHLVQNTPLAPEEIAELKRILTQKEK